MADPTTEELTAQGNAAEITSEQLDKYNGVAAKSGEIMDTFTEAVNLSGNAFRDLTDQLGKVNIAFNTTKSFTDQQIKSFGLISNAVLGARDSFNGLANIDTTGINTFSGQVQQLFKIITNESPASAAAINATKSVAETLAKAGRPIAEIEAAIKKGATAFKEYAMSVLTSADNGLKLQNAYIQMSAKTGELGLVTSLAGDKFQNMNALLDKQIQMLSRAEKATGASAEEIEKYWAELGTIPGALRAVVTSTGSASESTEMLTAAIKVARGTGRDFKDIIGDMKVAFQDYGLVGEDALRFSTRISEVTQHLGVELTTVQSALRDAAGTFKMYANAGVDAARMTEGIAGIMNSYAQALKSTGLNGTQAVDVVKNMTSQIGNLNIAQKSFLSAQTGGAGGLMGAFQIDKMMRDGRIGEVFEKVRQQMMRQMGSIVTVDEASKSPAAAAQLTKQIMLLKQGPLGQFARSDVEAERILEGFKARQQGTVSEKGLADDIVAQSMDKGTALQEKSYTAVNEILGHVGAIRRVADMSNLKFVQGTFAGGNAAKAMKSSGYMTGDAFGTSYAGAADTGILSDTTGATAVKAVKGFGTFLKGLPDKIKDPMEKFNSAMQSGDFKEANVQLTLLDADIKKRKSDMAKLSADKQKSAQDYLDKEMAFVSAAHEALSPGAKVGTAAKGVYLKPGSPAPNTGTTTASTLPIPPPPTQSFKVEVTGFCLKCKQEMDAKSQQDSYAPQAK